MAAWRYEISLLVLWNIFQHEKRNFVSPSGHVISYIYTYICGQDHTAECLFLTCLEMLFALYWNFWHILRIFLISNLIKLYDAWTRIWQKSRNERKRTRTTKQNTINNSSNLVEEVTPQILFLDNKSFVILNLRMRYFKWMIIFKNWFNSFFFVQEWNSNFCSQLELNNNHLFSFWT